MKKLAALLSILSLALLASCGTTETPTEQEGDVNIDVMIDEDKMMEIESTDEVEAIEETEPTEIESSDEIEVKMDSEVDAEIVM